jgi:pyruvate dehydrogenase E1 component
MKTPCAIDPDDEDSFETEEWLSALTAVARRNGPARAQRLLESLQQRALALGATSPRPPTHSSPYSNTIPHATQLPHPGDTHLEEQLTAIMRWNALAMVVRANQAYGELGGHIASYASAAEIFEVGFNHFFRARGGDGGRRPGVLPAALGARHLRARLSRGTPDARGPARPLPPGSRGRGLCSYPHPWLMPDFWQFPTGSMGIGPINADLPGALHALPRASRPQALRTQRRVWGVFGDGEMDEPESIAR